MTFILLAEKGINPPKHRHPDIESATIEAKRLSVMLDCSVAIFECVGVVNQVEVPVTRKETVVTMKKDDLPF